MSKSDGPEVKDLKSAVVFTHRYPEETAEAVRLLIEEAGRLGVQLKIPVEETEKHELSGVADDHVELNADVSKPPDICFALGGDGTILRALRSYLSQGVPVFGVNFGRIGFLSTIEHAEFKEGVKLALSGKFETLKLPSLGMETGASKADAVNDIALLRKPDSKVAWLSYSLAGERVGDVRCDGLVVATPAGSTGYNLANGGPILAWGVEGYVISFVAPHTLTARPLLAAAGDVLDVRNESKHESVAVSVDGRIEFELGPEELASISFNDDMALLAQLPGTNFYHRFRDKFGRL